MHQTMSSQAVGGAETWYEGSAHEQPSLHIVNIDHSTCARIAMNQRLNYNHVGSEHAGMQGRVPCAHAGMRVASEQELGLQLLAGSMERVQNVLDL
jgi:hypothetical protein